MFLLVLLPPLLLLTMFFSGKNKSEKIILVGRPYVGRTCWYDVVAIFRMSVVLAGAPNTGASAPDLDLGMETGVHKERNRPPREAAAFPRRGTNEGSTGEAPGGLVIEV